MQDLPRGTVTFLFTDIEGSTRLWQQHATAMTAAYARHDAILRRSIAAHKGVVFKTIGDAFQVAFPTAPNAIAATLAAQRALQAEPWPMPEPLRVRMALHTGAVDPDPNDDYRSPVLNRLGRLLAAAHGGQVLVSQATMELSRDHLPDATTLHDLGEQRLKDLYRPEQVYQLRGSDLLADFPPLRTLNARPNNLMSQPTQFIGREGEVTAMRSLLMRDDVRLVTITGPGGMGKTRLGLQVAADLLDHFDDGVFIVELAALTDPDLVPRAIATVLNVAEEGDRALTASLGAALQEKQLLLVLDNFEQVTGAATAIGDLLAGCPRLKVLATSRLRLGLRWERDFPVTSLDVPDPRRLPSLAALAQYDAVRLFIERAQAVKPAFNVTNANAPAVAEICVRLDGLPLAIELAAARVRMLPPEAMLKRLSARLPLLTGGARDLPERHQTLRGAIAWSHDLLIAQEQALFRRLATFAGGCTFDAIEAVVASDELDLDVLDGLERLVDHSLVRQTEDMAGEPRFGMLETIREFGLDELAAQGEAEEAHQRHATCFMEMAESAEPALKGGTKQGEWLERLETEHDNLRTALGWTLKHDPIAALRIAGALGRFWYMRGYLSEGRIWLEHALGACEDAPAAFRAMALQYAGQLSASQADDAVARDRYEAALALARELEDTVQMVTALNGLAIVAMNLGDLHRAETLFDEALTLGRASDNHHGASLASNNLGIVAAQQGDFDRANRLFEESLAITRDLDDRYGESLVMMNLGEVALARRQWVQARSLLRNGLELALAINADEATIAEAVASMGVVAGHAGQLELAARLFGAAHALVEAIGSYLDRVLPIHYEQAVSTVRDTLGKAEFIGAWQEGTTLTLEEAIAEALAVDTGQPGVEVAT